MGYSYVKKFAITSRLDGGRGIEIDPRELTEGVVD